MIDEKLLIEIEREYQEYISGQSENTQRHYMYWFSKFPHIQFLEALDQEVDEAQQVIRRFLFRIRDQNKKTTWDNSVCRGFLLSYLKCFNLHKKIEIPERKKTTKKRRIKPTLTKDEIQRISRVLKDNFKFRYWFAFNLMYHGALRKSELNSIRFNSFQWEEWFSNTDNDCYLIITGKGNKEREVLIPPEIMIALLNHLMTWSSWPEYKIRRLASYNEFVFSFGKNTLYKNIVKASMKALSGKKVNPHLIRHSKASHLLDLGVEIKDIQNYLGHSNISTTEVYLHRSQKQSLENIRKRTMNS